MASLQYRNNKILFSYQLQHPLNRSARQILWSCSQVGIETYSEWLLSWWYRPYGVFFIHWSCKKANKCLVAVEQLRQWWGTEVCNMKQDFRFTEKKLKMWHYSSTIVRNSQRNFRMTVNKKQWSGWKYINFLLTTTVHCVYTKSPHTPRTTCSKSSPPHGQCLNAHLNNIVPIC